MPEGPPVIKKLKPKVEDYRKILSNPKALAIINNKLIKYGKLEKAYNIIAKKAFYFLKEGGKNEYDFLQVFKVLLPTDLSINNTMLDVKSFQEGFNAISEEDLGEYRKQFVQYLLENPSAGIFFIFNLAKFEPD
jgi:hypothetical protein